MFDTRTFTDPPIPNTWMCREEEEEEEEEEEGGGGGRRRRRRCMGAGEGKRR